MIQIRAVSRPAQRRAGGGGDDGVLSLHVDRQVRQADIKNGVRVFRHLRAQRQHFRLEARQPLQAPENVGRQRVVAERVRSGITQLICHAVAELLQLLPGLARYAADDRAGPCQDRKRDTDRYTANFL